MLSKRVEARQSMPMILHRTFQSPADFSIILYHIIQYCRQYATCMLVISTELADQGLVAPEVSLLSIEFSADYSGAPCDGFYVTFPRISVYGIACISVIIRLHNLLAVEDVIRSVSSSIVCFSLGFCKSAVPLAHVHPSWLRRLRLINILKGGSARLARFLV